MPSMKKSVIVRVRETTEQQDRPINTKSPATKRSKSLFTVTHGQSLRSQLSDARFVLRWMVHTTLHDPHPAAFARRYVISPHRKNDRFVVSFGLPALSATPRVLDDAPNVRSSAGTWNYDGTLTAQEHRQVLNVASYNYLGFVDLNIEDRDTLQYALRSLPLADDGKGCNQRLEDTVKQELKTFLGMPGCALTASGYAINLLAFPAMAASSAADSSEKPVLLMDTESHSSMLVGAFIAHAATGARIVKFRHNSINDLRFKLDGLRRSMGSAEKVALGHVWVAIEGLYSMDGTVPPLPEIVALKQEYGFRIYIDEAHSILSIGSTGTGVVGYFQDREPDTDLGVRLSSSDVDMLGGTLSKSFSSVGGFVLCSGDLTQYVEARSRKMAESGSSSIPTLSLIRTLQILMNPTAIRQRLTHLRNVSRFVSSTLVTKGYRISTTPGAPICAIIFDNVKRVLDFLRVGRESGLLCCGAAYPAAPRGAPRVRLSLTGAHTWEGVHEMLRLIDQVAREVGVKGIRATRRAVSRAFDTNDPACQKDDDSASSLDGSAASGMNINTAIRALCSTSSSAMSHQSAELRHAGRGILSKHGLGAAGPRWMYGTSSPHLQLEQSLNIAVMKCVPEQRSPLESTDVATTLFTDAAVGLLSIISVCMEPLTPRRVKRGERHIVLLPITPGLEVIEGAAAAQRHASTHVEWYNGTAASSIKTTKAEASFDKIHLTVFIDVSRDVEPGTEKRRLANLLRPYDTSALPSLTIIISDGGVLSTQFESTREVLQDMASAVPNAFSSSKIQWILFSAFNRMPDLPGLQGAFGTGSKRLVEKIQFLGPGVMYTAMMPPVTAALAEAGVRRILDS
ncbi:hypothetical protein B0A48_17159 [Cryoendolithus antarcticus]|uniref:serine C-palmitoyltransferase n=1 Tax=Cryoendolithus antarcticus TaxID=1507870 RepID=A0A1V8SC43_9PEZI|nr:hypothetical protein B0A48_17159 [Cryoendolithus antarcticus]